MAETSLTIQSLGDAVKDRVRKAMFDAIPDDVLQSLIKTEFDNFFIDSKQHSYSSTVDPSPFKQMVKREVEAAMQEKLKKIISDKVNGLQQMWDEDSGGRLVGELVEQMAPAALTGIMNNIAGKCVNALRSGY